MLINELIETQMKRMCCRMIRISFQTTMSLTATSRNELERWPESNMKYEGGPSTAARKISDIR